MTTSALEQQRQTLQECIPYPIEPDRIDFKAITAWAVIGNDPKQRALLSKLYIDEAAVIKSPNLAQDRLEAALGRQVYDDITTSAEGSPKAYVGGLRRAIVLHGVLNGQSNQVMMENLKVGVSAIVAQRRNIERKFVAQYPTFRDLMSRVITDGWYTANEPVTADDRVPPLPVRKGVPLKPCEYDPDRFFEPGAEQKEIAKICQKECPQMYECLEEALTKKIDHGVWGGKTERERRALLRKSRGSHSVVMAQIGERSTAS